MADPNDFVTSDKPEGGKQQNTKAGYPGVGGLTTGEAEKDYQQASKEHFRDDVHKKRGIAKRQKSLKQKRSRSMPQIGSIEDVRNNSSVTSDPVGGVQTEKED